MRSGLIQPGLARCAHRRSSERRIDCLALTDGLHRLSLGGVFVRGRYSRPHGPGPARRIHPASRMIKLFIRPVCGGRPACCLRLGAGCVAPACVAPWVHTRLPCGLRASSSGHLRRGSCLALRCGLLMFLCPSWGGAPTLWGPPAQPWAGVGVHCPALHWALGQALQGGARSREPSRGLLPCLTFRSTVLGGRDFILRPY